MKEPGFSGHGNKLQCDNCCIKNHQNGTKAYYHQLLCGAIIHPNSKIIIALAPEAIIKTDGNVKNDCEINAFKRFIQDFRRDYPNLKAIVIGDSLFSNGPAIRALKDANLDL